MELTVSTASLEEQLTVMILQNHTSHEGSSSGSAVSTLIASLHSSSLCPCSYIASSVGQVFENRLSILAQSEINATLEREGSNTFTQGSRGVHGLAGG